MTVSDRTPGGQGDQEAPERDPYADCVCGHGRHTHVRYTGGCGRCDCAAVRDPSFAKPTVREEYPS